MITLRQIEAFCAIAAVGSFSAAAATLGMTQPALSKRLAEMEASIGAKLFDRSLRAVQLTAQGRAILKSCEQMLRIRAEIMATAGAQLTYSGPFRLGITELVAATILPDLLTTVGTSFPEMELHPEVSLSEDLFDKVESGGLDLTIAPGSVRRGLVSDYLGGIELAFMRSPTRLACPDKLSLAELARYSLLSQTERSALQSAVEDHFRTHNVTPTTRLPCNSLSAIAGLAIAGFGIGVLPRRMYAHRLSSGELKIIQVSPRLPKLGYFVAYRAGGLAPVCERITSLIKEAWANTDRSR